MSSPHPQAITPLISTCVPLFDRSPAIVQEAINSVAAAVAPPGEIIIAPQGERALDIVLALRLPSGVRVLQADVSGGLVENWNRCLGEARGDFIHILHDDDAVHPAFYLEIMRLVYSFPKAGLYLTGRKAFDSPEPNRLGVTESRPRWVMGESAARLILEGGIHACGSVVLPKRTVELCGLFSKRFPYCPDEEAYLRYAAQGGVALDPRPLYRERTSPDQARRATWRQGDFASVYLEARTEGARRYGHEILRVALESSAKAIVGVALTLALEGASQIAANHLETLARKYPPYTRSFRFLLARAALHNKGLLFLIGARRKVLESARLRKSQPRTGSLPNRD